MTEFVQNGVRNRTEKGTCQVVTTRLQILCCLALILALSLLAGQTVFAQSPKEIPLLIVPLEIGPGAGQDLHPSRDLAFITGLMEGNIAQSRQHSADVIDYADGYSADPGRVGAMSNFPLGRIDDFALLVKATLDVSPSQAGLWTIGIRSDDGARVRVNGRTVVQSDGTHGPTDKVGTVTLAQGTHALEFVYFNFRTTPGMIELVAKKGGNSATDAGFELIGGNTATSLKVTNDGFRVIQRFARGDLTLLEDAELLLRAPVHNVANYFLENSYGNWRFVPATQGDLDGLPDGVASDTTVSASGETSWAHLELATLVTDPNQKRRAALEAADPKFNYAYYDAIQNGGNGNGTLDPEELVVVAFTGQPDGATPCGNSRIPQNVSTLNLDGLDVNSNYYVVAVTQWCGWITLVHEITHLLENQLTISINPLDFYHLDNDVPTTTGDLRPYDVMASGSYDKYTTHHNPWTKMKFGWLTPRKVSSTDIYALDDIESNPDLLRLENPADSSEYLLLENRWRGQSYDSAALHTDFPGMTAPATLTQANRWEFRPDDGIIEDGLVVYHVIENRLANFNSGDYSSPQFIRRLDPSRDEVWHGQELLRDLTWNDGTSVDVMACNSPPDSRLFADIRFNSPEDPYDDGVPAGELRNDSRANAASVELKQGIVAPGISLDLPWRVHKGGRNIYHADRDLNIDSSTDEDHLKVSVDLAGFAYSQGPGSECPSGHGVSGQGFSTQFDRGSLRISTYYNVGGPLDIELTDAAGKALPGMPFIERWSNSWSAGIEIDCPTANLPDWPDSAGQGVVFARISSAQNTCSFYELIVEYKEAEVFAVDRNAFPHPVWELGDVKVLRPRPDSTELIFPADPAACPKLPCVPDPDHLAFVWPETSDLKIDIRIADNKQMLLTVIGADGTAIEKFRIQGEGRIAMPNLPSGGYQISAVSDAAPVFYSARFLQTP